MDLIYVMCYMNQSVVVVPVPNEASTTLAYYFMQCVLIKFGLCHLIVLDDGTTFKGSFIASCEALNDVLVKCNHKGLAVEHFHRFLNERVPNVAEVRDTNGTFVSVGIVTCYP